ncbi:MAG: hypothetical protein AAFQ08_02595 [Bacteroidota bacterium]
MSAASTLPSLETLSFSSSDQTVRKQQHNVIETITQQRLSSIAGCIAYKAIWLLKTVTSQVVSVLLNKYYLPSH